MSGARQEGAAGGEKVKMNNGMLLILALDIYVHLAHLKFLIFVVLNFIQKYFTAIIMN